MRKLVVAAFVSLDGVIQAPGGPEEDRSGGFEHGGWTVPYWGDSILGGAVGEMFSRPFDLLLGRRTYDIFASHWPEVEKNPKARDFPIAQRFGAARKYVATHRPEGLTWKNSEGLGDDVEARVRELKKGEGPLLLTQGSSELVHQLLASDLVDELRLLVYPLVLGKGKRLFAPDASPGAYKLTKSSVSSGGVILADYERAGKVATGSFQLEPPTAAEQQRRQSMR